MTKTYKIVLLIASVFAVSQLILIGFYYIQLRNYEQSFWQIKVGQEQETVINLMGKASEIKSCNPPLNRYKYLTYIPPDKYRTEGCSEIYGYFFLGSYWAIAFDEQGKVIKTFHWTIEDGYGKPEEFNLPF